MAFQFKAEVMWDALPVLLSDGLYYTIVITAIGLAFGFVMGVLAGLMKLSRFSPLRWVAAAYIEAIRGTPLMVQVMFLYFGIPMATGIRVTPLTAGIISIAMNSGAYIAEIVRGAVQSINRGQMEAARSTGLSHTQSMVHVIGPQAFKRMIPPLGNQFIISLKDTSLLVVIGVGELTRTGQEIISVNFRAFEVWLTVAILYLALTLSIARFLRFLEKRYFTPTGRA